MGARKHIRAEKLKEARKNLYFAKAKGVTGYWDNTGMLTSLGEKIHFSEGSDLNIKVNTTEDVAMFRALYIMSQTE